MEYAYPPTTTTTTTTLKPDNSTHFLTTLATTLLTAKRLDDASSPATKLNLIFTFYKFSKWMNVILITIINVIGLYGNLMSINIFMSKSYPNFSLRVYLILLSLSDQLVLALHYIDFTFRSWVNLTESYSSRFNFVDKCLLCCKLIPYLRNVFRTISVYTLLLMTFQRYVVLYFPLVRAKWCSIKFTKRILFVLILISLVLNVNNLILNDLEVHQENQEHYCTVKKEYIKYQFVIDIVFVMFTILIPTIFVLVISFVLLSKIKSNAPKDYFNLCLCNINFSPNRDSLTDKTNADDDRRNEFNSNMDSMYVMDAQNAQNANNTNQNMVYNSTSQNTKLIQPSYQKFNDVSVYKRTPTASIHLNVDLKKDRRKSSTNYTIQKQSKPRPKIKKSFSDNAFNYAYERRANDASSITGMNKRVLRKKLSLQEISTFLRNYEQQMNQGTLNFAKKSGHSVRTTYMLVLISKWFVILHLPYFICWIIFHLHMNEQAQLVQRILAPPTPSPVLESSAYDLQQAFYYMSKSLNGSKLSNRTTPVVQKTTLAALHTVNDNYNYNYNYNTEDREEKLSYIESRTMLIRGLVNLFEILFLFNYSINFLLYNLNGPLFRKRHKKLLSKYFLKFLTCIYWLIK